MYHGSGLDVPYVSSGPVPSSQSAAFRLKTKIKTINHTVRRDRLMRCDWIYRIYSHIKKEGRTSKYLGGHFPDLDRLWHQPLRSLTDQRYAHNG